MVATRRCGGLPGGRLSFVAGGTVALVLMKGIRKRRNSLNEVPLVLRTLG